MLASALGATGLLVAGGTANGVVVINEVYGGGGNSGASFNRDFFELFNTSATQAITIGGYQLQYGSATGTIATSGGGTVTIPAGTTLAPLSFYLITGASANTGVGTPVPTGNLTSSIDAAGANGKLRLVASAGSTTALDLVGYGTANEFEGAGAAPAASAALAITRTAGIDTNNNNADFRTATPTPVPEPTSLGLLAAGGLLLGRRRRLAR